MFERTPLTAFAWQAARFAGMTVAAVGVAALIACTHTTADPSKSLLPVPTATPTPVGIVTVPPVELSVALVLDVTNSTRVDYLTGAESFVADALDSWPQPGRGGVELGVTLINSFSYDPVNEVLVDKVDGLPAVPPARETKARPSQPDLRPCQQNAFTRVKCEEALATDYNTALTAALHDEQSAEEQHQQALAANKALALERAAEMKTVTDKLRNLELKRDNTASDISGGILRAAEFLGASQAPHKRLIIQSDLDPTGPQQRGTLQLQGVDVLVIFWDCRESDSCAARKDDATQRFVAAGAASVAFYDPAASHLLTTILGVPK